MRIGVFSALVVMALTSGSRGATEVALRADPARSKLQIELGTAGFLKFMGDEHLIDVGSYQCEVNLDEKNPANSSVKLVVKTASLKVQDPKLEAEKRAEVQETMRGPKVLDVAKYPEITFESKKVSAGEEGKYRVEGDLTIRGATRPVAFDVTLEEKAGVRHARGVARVKQTAFGIEPVSAGGGTVKVKDEMKIVFDLALVAAK